MKKLFILLLVAGFVSFTKNQVAAQCGVGYTQAQLNWDNLDYYFNSGGASPYGSYVTSLMEQNQKFVIGTNWLTIATSSSSLVTTTENATHTGDITGYTGVDVQYNPSANGQTVTITFDTEVQNASFSLYDLDYQSRYDFLATNNVSVAQNVNIALQASTILTVTNNNSTTAYVSTTSTSNLGNASNQGTATITVAGPVKTIRITITTRGSDPVFWLSDINACVIGTFPANWHQGFSNQPFVGPTQNQPDYFLVTPDNNSCYMMNPATGNCYWLFTDASKTYMNSFAYDPDNKILYYISENLTLDANNKTLKKYDFNTESTSTVIANIGTTLGIPTFNSGVESAAAAYYNGKLYFGIEGGQSTSSIRESIVWCIELATLRTYQVYATPSYNATDMIHDWADILVKDGILINYNSAKIDMGGGIFNYPNSSVSHINMMTGVATKYVNPVPASFYAGQAGMNWSGNLYSVYNVVQPYDGAGVIGASIPISVISVPGDPAPPAWAGAAGDASDPFRPKCDFGDAPASYDPYATPATQSPAVHERSELIRLGATWDREFWKKGTTGTEDGDDGIASLSFLPPGGNGYLVQVSAFNNSGANATMIAWLDYNGNGLFDASEAITPITVPSSAAAQNFWLYWPSTPNSFTAGQFTYLRVRITAQSAGMTTSHATGYFTNGEVEDYRVSVDNFPLATHLLSFDAIEHHKTVKLNWKVEEDAGIYAYDVERSNDNINWSKINTVNANSTNGTFSYEITDANPLKGDSYYRLRLIESTGMNKFSPVKHILIKDLQTMLTIAPNPVKDQMIVRFQSVENSEMKINILSMQGNIVLSSKQRISAGLNNLALQLPASVSNGTYIVRIVVNGEVINKKLIVNR